MKVVATIAAAGKGQKAACAVKITAGGFTHTRVIPFKKATVNQAELFALGYVLTAIKSGIQDAVFEVTTFNSYVGRILERNGDAFVVTPEKNIELVKEIRDLAVKRTVAVTTVKTDDVMALRDLIKKETETANAK